MKKLLAVSALLFLSAGLAQAQDIAGDWQGTLSAGGAELRLVLHITKAADGSLKATLDSVDQGGQRHSRQLNFLQRFQAEPGHRRRSRHL
ncbi:MAG: hypothetical protein ABR881_07455 [Candidatus Sulfotelmatobacter sp.]